MSIISIWSCNPGSLSRINPLRSNLIPVHYNIFIYSRIHPLFFILIPRDEPREFISTINPFLNIPNKTLHENSTNLNFAVGLPWSSKYVCTRRYHHTWINSTLHSLNACKNQLDKGGWVGLICRLMMELYFTFDIYSS